MKTKNHTFKGTIYRENYDRKVKSEVLEASGSNPSLATYSFKILCPSKL